MMPPLSTADTELGVQAMATDAALDAIETPALGLPSAEPEAEQAPLLRIRILEATTLEGPIRLEAGEMLAILGLDHSARDQLTSFLNGDKQPPAGHLDYLGQDLAEQPLFWSKERPPEILVIPPEGTLLANFNAWENIWLVVCYHQSGQTRQLMEEVFQIMPQLGLDESWPIRRPGSLDPWQRQAISCARAMTLQPKLLVLNAIFEGANQAELAFGRQLLKVLSTYRPQTAVLYLGNHLAPGLQIKRQFLDS